MNNMLSVTNERPTLNFDDIIAQQLLACTILRFSVLKLSLHQRGQFFLIAMNHANHRVRLLGAFPDCFRT